MSHPIRSRLILAALVPIIAGLAAGCAHDTGTRVAAADPVRTVTHAEGRYQLYGDGVTTPYYWVWLPAGTMPPRLGPPPAPPAATTLPVPPPAVTTADGHYRLYGNGTTTRTTGSGCPPASHPRPRRRSRGGAEPPALRPPALSARGSAGLR
jgi:hypothetical protein